MALADLVETMPREHRLKLVTGDSRKAACIMVWMSGLGYARLPLIIRASGPFEKTEDSLNVSVIYRGSDL